MNTKFWHQYLKGRSHLQDLSTYYIMRILLKWIIHVDKEDTRI